ncbi:hypothetical protein [Hydrogenophaga sp. RWCD_12]|uniref:hypothetical protein n=1 Tax=Hydrogenophaga sp. RWCD_12 TaxID=3391190 RepID=UPI003984788C
MLQLDSRSISIEGVTVFRDHADASQFWYLPGPVTLSKRDADQRTQFTYLKYKNRGGTARRGGGYLMIETRLRLDPDLERRVLERLASISRGRPRLAPVPFDDGTVSCVALNLQGSGGTRATTSATAPEGSFNAVESILGAGKPSLAGDNTAVFSLELSAEGATILEKALKDGTTPIGVIYDLKYTGLRPAFNVKITADFNQVFTHFSTSADGQRGFVRAGIDTGFERLVRSGAIKIEVADMTGTPENEARIKEALDFFKAQVLNTWFTPVLTPGTLAATAATAASLDQVRLLGEQLRPPQPQAPERPGATPTAPATDDPGPSPTEGTGHGPAATGLGANGASAGASASSSPTEGSGEPATSTPPPGGAGTRSGTTPVAAAADRSAPGTPRRDEAVAAFRLRSIRQEERRTATFEYNRSEAQQRTYAPQGFIGLMARELNRPPYFVEIDLDDPFFQTIKVEAKAPFAFETLGLKEIHLQLDYGPVSDPNNHRRQDFVFSADDHATKSVEFVVNLRKDQTYAWQAQYHFDPTSGWEGEHFSHDAPRIAATDDRTLVLNPMESIGFLQLRVEPGRIDPGVIDFTEVEMAYEDPSGWKREKSGRIVAATPTALEWKLRISPTSTRSWRYQVRHHLKDGSVVELPPVTTRATSVVVDDPYPGSLDLTIFPIVDFSTVRAAMLDVNYADPAHHYTRHERVRLTPEMTEARVRFSTPDPSKKRYSHQLTVVHTDGRTERPALVETENDVITVVI